MSFVLDAYSARSCPVKTFNTFDPTLPDLPLDESLREAFQGGSDFRDLVLERVVSSEGVVDLRAGARGPSVRRPPSPRLAQGPR